MNNDYKSVLTLNNIKHLNSCTPQILVSRYTDRKEEELVPPFHVVLDNEMKSGEITEHTLRTK